MLFSAQRCSGIRAPINGKVSKGFGEYKDLVTYSCNSNEYRLNGPVERECQANGQWSGREPTCDRMYIRVEVRKKNSIHFPKTIYHQRRPAFEKLSAYHRVKLPMDP